MRANAWVLLLGLALAGCARLPTDALPPGPLAFPSGRPHPAPAVERSRLLSDRGGPLDWCARSDQIVFARQESPTLSELYVIRPDGTGERCLTCNQPDLPPPPPGLAPGPFGPGYRSAPAWHPSCEFLVFQMGNSEFRANPFERPPFGIHNDLWLITADGQHAEPLIATGRMEGVMSAFFSAEGDRLVWSQRAPTRKTVAQHFPGQYPGEEDPFQGWALKLAGFHWTPGAPAALDEPLELLRGEPGVKRPSALFGQLLWFAHTRGFQRYVDEIWRMDLTGDNRENVSRSPRTWEEQALPSPWGTLLAWRSSLPYGWRMGPHRPNTLRLELWVQDEKGERTQLTHLNRVGDNRLRALVQDFAWGPTGREIAIFATAFEVDRDPRHELQILTLNHAF